MRRIAVLVTLVTAIVIAVPVLASSQGDKVNGVWHRENGPDHERLVCSGPAHHVHCDYDSHVPTNLDGTIGHLHGVRTDECDVPFDQSVCDEASWVVDGQMTFHSARGSFTPFTIHEQLIGQSDGSMVLVWVDRFHCPWFRTFEEAVAQPSACTFPE